MAGGREKPPPDREKTDDSLRAERLKADTEFERRRRVVDEEADDVVRVARGRADAVLQEARDREDDRVRADGGEVSEELRERRAHEDAVVSSERHTADETVAAERRTRQLALASLVALERAETDVRLLLERRTADQLLSSRDDLLGIVSHDLRSFLAAVALNAEMLRRLAEKNSELAEAGRYLAAIQLIVAQMTRLIGDLLDAASIDAGKLAVVPTRQNAGRLVRQVVEVIRPAAADARVSLSAEIADDVDLDATFDAQRILQVLTR